MDKIKIPSYIVEILKEASQRQKELELRKGQLLSLYLKANTIDGEFGLSEDQEWLVSKEKSPSATSTFTE